MKTSVKQRERVKAYYEANKEVCVARVRAYKAANKAKVQAACKAYTAAHREEARLATARWCAANPERHKNNVVSYRTRHQGKVRAWNAARKKQILAATPKWADKKAICAIYEEAALRGLSVDHIIPLRGKLVCGLHVHTNLRVIPLVENVRKGSRYV